MTNEIIKNIFTVAFGATDDTAKQHLNESRARLIHFQERQKHIQELIPQVTGVINDIIRRSKQVPPESLPAFYEKELGTLCQGLTGVVTTNAEEVSKLRGAVAAAESLIKIYNSSSSRFDAELQKARDIQERQAEGSLGKMRKPGQRPDKLKDVRNYASTSGTEE